MTVRTTSGSIGTSELMPAPTMNGSIAFCAGPSTPRVRLRTHHAPIVPTSRAPARSMRPPIAVASAAAASSAGAVATAASPMRSASVSSGPAIARTASAAPYGNTTTARLRGRRRPESASSGARKPAAKNSTPSACGASGRRSGEAELLPERGHELLDLHPDLGHVVAVADRDRLICQGIEIDGHAQRRTDLVLAPVPPADGLGLVVRRLEVRPQPGPDRARQLAQLRLLRQRQHRDLVRRQVPIEPEHDADAVLVWLLVVR